MNQANRKVPLVILLLIVVIGITGCSVFQPSKQEIVLPKSTDEVPSPTIKLSPTRTPVPIDTLEPSSTPFPYPTTPVDTRSMRISIVYDNTTYDPQLESAWGFGAVIEYDDHTFLFDTGGSGSILEDNMKQMGIDPKDIEFIVLSHIHGDHTDGLMYLLQKGIKPSVYLPKAFPETFKYSVGIHTEVVEIREPVEIIPGVYSTGEMGGIVEQALVVETREGIVVITGCAHPGVVRMVRKAKSIMDRDVALVLGGFHLSSASDGDVEQIISNFRSMCVKQVSPAHCTGERAINMFADEYGDDCLQAGVGRVLVVVP
jgi:7,8-dihydropterin-6-yl-methyl-4-(beta-D-ribofuranosyl)aminobenzene 5'-phosphate synthase